MSTADDNHWLATSWSATSFARAIVPAATVTVTGPGDRDSVPVQISDHHAVVNGPAFAESSKPPLLKRLSDRIGEPTLSGAVLHCCALWMTPPPLPSSPGPLPHAAVARMLWAPRAESTLIRIRPYDRLFLRAHAIKQATWRDPLTGSISVYARAHNGVFPARTGQQAAAAALEAIDESTVTDLIDICHEVSELAEDDGDGLQELVQRWLDIAAVDAAGIEVGAVGNFLSDLGDEVAAETALLSLAQPTPHLALDTGARSDGTAASTVFRVTTPPRGRVPTAADVEYRTELVDRLSRIQITAMHRFTVPATYPGIRLSSTKLVQQRAQRTFKIPVTAKPWRVVRHGLSSRPPLHCGLVIDVSPSNAAWLSGAGTAAWALAAATRRLGGRCAGTTFGGKVRPLLHPTAQPREIPIAQMSPSSSGCGEAVKTTAEVLNLNQSQGARILFVLTDGLLPTDEEQAINAAIDTLVSNEVAVVWALTRPHTPDLCAPAAATIVDNVEPDQFPRLLADVAATALESIFAHRNR